jgi:transposase InsO family protein
VCRRLERRDLNHALVPEADGSVDPTDDSRRVDSLQRVAWRRACVWAVDFTEAPLPVDGHDRYLLAVRDLASGQQLLWLPVAQATAQETMQALAGLFVVWGAPLVLKSDNGSPFIAEATQARFVGHSAPRSAPPQV